MITTEKEALSLWCPKMKLPTPHARCIGAMCMALRWQGWRDDYHDVCVTESPRPPFNWHHKESLVRVGYCGLAGQP